LTLLSCWVVLRCSTRETVAVLKPQDLLPENTAVTKNQHMIIVTLCKVRVKQRIAPFKPAEWLLNVTLHGHLMWSSQILT